MSYHDEKTQEVPVCRPERDCKETVSSDLGVIRGQSQTAQGQERPKMSQHLSAQAIQKVPKKREKTCSKLIVSAEVSQGVWDSAKDAIELGKYKSMSELVRRAVVRELGKPVRLR